MFSKILKNYLRFWAVRYLRRAKPQIIAITGSVGKTSTKDAIFEVLRAKFGAQVRKSEGNLNNETGVPLGILNYKNAPSYGSSSFGWIPIFLSTPFKSLFVKKVKILVLELAADKPGDIQYLTSFIKPNLAVITSIGPAHLAAFGDIKKVIEEKVALVEALPADGSAIINIDDENLKKVSKELKQSVKTFAITEEADVSARNITTEIINYQPLTKFQIVSKKYRFLAEIHTLGRRANVYPAIAAAAVAEEYGITKEQLIQGLANIYPEKHRMMVQKGKNGAIILDDCYNANPLSMKAALETLETLPARPAGGRKIAVLGEMKELGQISKKAHQLIGEYARAICDQIISIGPMAKDYQANVHFEQKKDLINYLLANIHEGDIMQGVPIILLKASRGGGSKPELEEVVEALKI